jgi:hypothetical protein
MYKINAADSEEMMADTKSNIAVTRANTMCAKSNTAERREIFIIFFAEGSIYQTYAPSRIAQKNSGEAMPPRCFHYQISESPYFLISSFLATFPLSVNISMVYIPDGRLLNCKVCLSLLSASALYIT